MNKSFLVTIAKANSIFHFEKNLEKDMDVIVACNNETHDPLLTKTELMSLVQSIENTLQLYEDKQWTDETIQSINKHWRKNRNICLLKDDKTGNLIVNICDSYKGNCLYLMPNKKGLKEDIYKRFAKFHLKDNQFKFDKSIIDYFEALLNG